MYIIHGIAKVGRMSIHKNLPKFLIFNILATYSIIISYLNESYIPCL